MPSPVSSSFGSLDQIVRSHPHAGTIFVDAADRLFITIAHSNGDVGLALLVTVRAAAHKICLLKDPDAAVSWPLDIYRGRVIISN